MKPFYVICYNPNSKKFYHYDIMPYLMYKYKNSFERRPKSHEEFVEFVDAECRYQYWGRCEYEFILTPWPPNIEIENKIDIYWQLEPNIDTIASLLEQNVK